MDTDSDPCRVHYWVETKTRLVVDGDQVKFIMGGFRDDGEYHRVAITLQTGIVDIKHLDLWMELKLRLNSHLHPFCVCRLDYVCLAHKLMPATPHNCVEELSAQKHKPKDEGKILWQMTSA